MAAEIPCSAPTGLTLYAQVRNSVGKIWNTNSGSFVDYDTANIADYAVAMTEQGTASGYYTGDFPAAGAGVYPILVLRQVGGSPAESDPVSNEGSIDWDGLAVRGAGGLVERVEQTFSATDATNNTVQTMGENGQGLSLIPWNPAWDADAQSEAADALAAVGLTTTVTNRIDAAVSTRSIPGDAMTLTAGALAAVAAAVWAAATRTLTAATNLTGMAVALTTPGETAGRPTTLEGMIRRLFEGRHNKRTRNRTTGELLIRNAADNATLETATQSTATPVDTQTAGA